MNIPKWVVKVVGTVVVVGGLGAWFYSEHRRLVNAEAAFAYLTAEVGKTEDKRVVRVGDILQRLVNAELEKLTVKPAPALPAPAPAPVKKD